MKNSIMGHGKTNAGKLLLFILVITLALSSVLTACGKKNEEYTPSISGIEDLPGKTIGVQLGTTGDTYIKDYENEESGTKVVRYNKATDAIQDLKLKKIDGVILDELPALAYAKKNTNLSIIEEEFVSEEYAICIAKGRTELKEKINGALSKLKEDGTLDAINAYYIDNENGDKKRYEKKEIERNGVLKVGTNASFKPYEYYEGGEIIGIDVDIMQAICDIMGMELKIVDMEFESIISAVNSERVDVGAAGMTVNEERLKNIDFTDGYTTTKQVIIINNGKAEEKLSFAEKFKQNFIDDNRYEYLLTGLKNTLIITLGAIIIGTILGMLLAVIRASHDKNGGLTILNAIANIYITIIRGTPALVQILIMYYIILVNINNKIAVAIIAFGLNSAAYVAEVVRSGIMSVDAGQFEAGRSLGLNYRQTMVSIIMPQAIKNILPALCNEFISLIKETSISGYIGLVDLTKGGDIIRSNTWEPYFPLFSVALIYLVIVLIFTGLARLLEKKLRNSDR